MKYKLVDLEWWFWCPNEGLLTQEFTSRQQKTCMSNFQWPNPRWPPFYRNIAKIAMKQELIDLEWWFWCSNVGILGKGFTSRQQKTCMSNIQGPNPRWPPFYISRSNGYIFFCGYFSNIILVIFFRYPWHVTYLLSQFCSNNYAGNNSCPMFSVSCLNHQCPFISPLKSDLTF